MKKTFLLGIAVLAFTYLFSQHIYYVDIVNGINNKGTGAFNTPFKTIQEAADIVAPGDTVIVRDGVYTANSNYYVVNFKASGNASKWIVFKSEHRGGAVISGNNYTTDYGFTFNPGVAYVQIQDFMIKEMLWTGIDIENTSNVKIIGNEIRNIGRVCTSTQYGKTGIFGYISKNITIEKNKFFNIGRYSLGEKGCNTNINNEAHDHAVYIEGGSSWLIKNNIFDSISHGWGVHVYSGHNQYASDIIISNNVFYNPNPKKDGQIILSYPGVSNTKIVNNIFYKTSNCGVFLDISDVRTKFSNVNILNNLIYPSKGSGSIYNLATQGVTESGNLANTDPLFINSTIHEPYLLPNSPAIDKGLDMQQSGVSDDYNGICRPQNNKFDIGAYETVAAQIKDYSNQNTCRLFYQLGQKLSFYLDITKPTCINADIANINWIAEEFEANGNKIGLIGSLTGPNAFTFNLNAPNTAGLLVITADAILKNGSHLIVKYPMWVIQGADVSSLVKIQQYDANLKDYVDYDWNIQKYLGNNNLYPNTSWRMTIQTPQNVPVTSTLVKDFSDTLIYSCSLNDNNCINAIKGLVKPKEIGKIPGTNNQWTYFQTGPNNSYLAMTITINYKNSCTNYFSIPFTVKDPIKLRSPFFTNINIDESSKLVESDITIFPNPCQGTFTISAPNIKGKVEVEIYDAMKKLVYKKSINNFLSKAVYVNNLNKGVYFLHLKSNSTSIIKKLTVQ